MSMTETRGRITAVDALRGLVMVIMALDHTREFLHTDAMRFSAENLAYTTPALFLTRWVTHLCAPVFFATAGMAAGLRLARGGSHAELSRYLVTRGLWLIAVEVVVMRLAMNFTFDLRYPVFLIILWALGWSMVALAGLIYLPARVVGIIGLVIIAGHNTLDRVPASAFGPLAWLWHVLHQPGLITIGPVTAIAGYPVLPWTGVMALGFWAASLYTWLPERRARALRLAGLAALAGFVLLRTLNGYGNPAPWTPQASPAMTAVSFLNTAKYPPSLIFLLMTLGPAALLLARLERAPLGARHPFVVFGRVPFAYYVVHFWLLHAVAALAAFLRYGTATWAFLRHPFPSMGGAREMFPADLGYPLWVVYVAWLLLVTALYPAGRWLAEVKARRRDWWLSYL
jgi:uncharacterized membrane protein